jgi:serine-type D-Ala-D-Ala carboxypeptidase/endopeptidase (penicillin-binding protein 4)
MPRNRLPLPSAPPHTRSIRCTPAVVFRTPAIVLRESAIVLRRSAVVIRGSAVVLRLLATLWACACACVWACSPGGAAAAYASPGGLAALQADLGHQLALAGPASGAYVYDLTARQALFSERATALRPPASVEKLYTATTALSRMGASARLSTTVLGAGQLAPGGVWEGDLYLRGGGDPTFGSASFIRSHYGGEGATVSALVAQLVRVDGIHHVTGSVFGDESYLDSLRGEPYSGYAPDPFLEGALSGLAFNRGATGSQHGPHAPAAYAARELWATLKSDGVTIHGSPGAATTPAGVTQLAQVQSPTIAQLLGLMLPPSDNFFAETLVKDLGARYGGAGTTSAGASVVHQTISSLLGIHPHVVDGSGLSESDLTSPYQVTDLLVELAPTPIGAVLRGALAVAGHTGTLAERMRHSGAAGRCKGKTGTLTGVSNLVGYCQSADGHLLAFAIFTDGIATATAHTLQDHMAITIADY